MGRNQVGWHYLLCGLMSKSEFCSSLQRNEVIKDLCKQKINQETIAAMLDISQSTVSNVLRKK